MAHHARSARARSDRDIQPILYEEVLIARVHPEILRGEGLPDSSLAEQAVWHNRYRSIVDLERHLHANGTLIIKFFLHLSKEEPAKALSRAPSMRRKRTGNSALRISRRGSFGITT